MLDKIKIMLGIAAEETDLDSKLNLIIELATSRLKVLLGNVEPPAELQYIILEVAVKRFNKVSSEGFSSHSVEGESFAFTENDFDEFKKDIQSWIDTQKTVQKGKVRFI